MANTFLVKPKSIFFVGIGAEKELFNRAFSSFNCIYFERVDECFKIFEKLMDFPDLLFIEPGEHLDESLHLMKFVSVLGIPIVVILDIGTKKNETTFLAAGGLNVLYKPITADVLYQKLDMILQKSFIQNNFIDRVSFSAIKNDARYFDKSAEGDVFFQALSSLSSVLDAKDSYTQGHSLRVGLYACLLARKAELPDKDIAILHYCSLVHDIGKIGVPDAVLRKSGKLSKSERGLINRHTVLGYDILKSITFMPELCAVARSHHERWDGSGYPDGLSGNNIPMYARIVSLADSFDAMTSNRSYRPSMSFEKARDEIIRCQGTEFDPEFSEMAVSVIDEYLTKKELPSLFPG